MRLPSLVRSSLLLLSLAGCGLSAPAQTPPAAPTLAAALAQALPPAVGVAVSVGADKVTLPSEGVLPGPTATVNDVAAAYGRLVQHFGDVAAVAPPTMAVVSVPPAKPDPFDGMPPADVLRLLAGSLSDAQWDKLYGPDGLGLDDLTTETQRGLFAALFPGGKLQVLGDHYSWPPKPAEITDLSAEIPRCRLRLGQNVAIALPIAGKPTSHLFAGQEAPPGAPKQYIDYSNDSFAQDYLAGARVRAEEPNAPKRGQLDYRNPALQVPVSIGGLKTVGDLVARIGQATRVELYADARLAGKPLTVTGRATAARAADLLRALALCVTGTYRNVGPAFVLTDDVVGIGTRKQLWTDFDALASALRAAALATAAQSMGAAHTLDRVGWFGDPLALTDAEMAAYRKQQSPGYPGGMRNFTLPLDQLSPAQQSVARQIAERQNKNPGNGDKVTLDGQIMVQTELMLQILAPSLDGPIAIFGTNGLFPTPAMPMPPPPAPGGRYVPPPAPTAAALRTSLARVPRRAVLASPRTAAGVLRLVASMRRMGLNQLWLDVFSDGVSRIPGTPLSPAGQPDLLAEALKDTRGTGIQVFASLDLLAWGKDTPAATQDRTLAGETLAQATARARLEQAYQSASGPNAPTPAPGPVPDRAFVSPFAPEVRDALVALVRDLHARKGLSGLVWRETAAPGYLFNGSGYDAYSGPGQAAFGYADAARLAFLRAAHADPVDLFQNYYTAGHAHTDIPLTSDFTQERALYERWRRFLADGSLSFLRALAAEAGLPTAPPAPGRAAPPHPALVLASRGAIWDSWYGTWDDLRRDPPTFVVNADPFRPPPVQARAESAVAYQRVQPDRGWSAETRARVLGGVGVGWGGFVLDYAPSDGFNGPAPRPAPPDAGADGDPLAAMAALFE